MPGVQAPVDYHTPDCPRLDDIVMRAFLEGDDTNTGEVPNQPDQELRRRLWQLRHKWLTQALNQTVDTPEGVSVGLGQAALDLRDLLEEITGG
jgi:hypothetical protein